MTENKSRIIGRIPRNSEEEVRVQLTNYKGQSGLDFRIFYRPEDSDSDLRPTQRGVRISVEDFDQLMSILKKADSLINSMKEKVGD